MKKGILFLTVLLSFLFSFNNCDDAVSDNSTYTSIDSQIIIQLREELSTTKKDLYFDCSTTRIYGCINYGIDYSVFKTANNIRIKFTNIVVSQICLTALGPATNRINLGELNEGNYNLNLEVNGKTETAQLIVKDDSYKINFLPGFNFKFKSTELNRVPQYLIWGSVGYIYDSLTNVADTFIDSLQILGASTVNLFPGDYGFFKISPNGNIITPDNHGYPFIKMYMFDYRNNLEEIKGLMKRIQQQYVNEIYIGCNTWQGDTFYGWTL